MEDLLQFLAVHKALGDASRVRALSLLAHGELCVCDLVDALGLAASTVSAHMTVLHRAGLVQRRRDGRWQHFRLAGRDAPIHVRAALRALRALETDPQIRADAERLRASGDSACGKPSSRP